MSQDSNTKEKVHYLTRIRLGFVEDTIFDSKTGLLHWIPKSLSYETADHPGATKFISEAMELHSGMVGLGVDEYKKEL